MNLFPVLLQRNLHAQCASQARACVLCAKLLQCCCPRTWPARVPGAMQRQASTFLTQQHCKLHTFTSELFSSGFMSSHMSATFFLAIFMSSERSSNFLMRCSYFQLISALLHVSKVERNSCRFFCMPKGVDNKIFTILRSLMPSVDALHQIATASVNMVQLVVTCQGDSRSPRSTDAFFPSCQVRVVRFYVSCLLLPRPPPQHHPQLISSSSSSSSLSSLSSLSSSSSSSSSSNCDPRSHSVLCTDPQAAWPATPSVQCRTSTTTSHAQSSLPELDREYPRPVVPCRTSTTTIDAQSTASIHAKRYAT